MMKPLHLSLLAAATVSLSTAFTSPALLTHRSTLQQNEFQIAPAPLTTQQEKHSFQLCASTLDSPRNKAESEFENKNEQEEDKKQASFLRRLASTFRKSSGEQSDQEFETHEETEGSLSTAPIPEAQMAVETEEAPLKKRSKNTKPANLFMAKTIQEYKTLVAEEREQMVVVRWYATYCRACKAVQPSFYRLAETYPNVKFVEVPCNDKNVMLHQGLGVPTVPYAHIYHPDPEVGLVEEMKMSKKHFRKFHEVLTWHVQGSCDTPDGDSTNPHAAIDAKEELEPQEGTALNFE